MDRQIFLACGGNFCENIHMPRENSAIRNKDLWQAIDRLAAAHGLSVSGLAKRAGLDPTALNKSKRAYPDGRLRWPTMESISRLLAATQSGFSEFISHLEGEGQYITHVPLIGFAQAGNSGYFDDAGYPLGVGWDEIAFPDIRDGGVYALEISGSSMEPVYRDGDRLIVSPAANIRRGDRVVVKTSDGRVMAKELLRRTASKVELRSFNDSYGDLEVPRQEVEWIARVLWASQ